MLFFVICAVFALYPENVLSGAQNGLALCINAVIPSLLPFFVISGCIIKSNFARPLGAMLSKILSPLTGMSGQGCVCFITGLIGGYGAGARAISQSYSERLISKEEAQRLLAFCNNAGPLFVIGTVGVGFYGSKSTGIMLFFIQVITALICGRIFSGNFRQKCRVRDEWNYYKKNKPSSGELVVKSAIESGSAIITASVFVIAFSAIMEVLPFGEMSFFSGILEVTRGCSEMARRSGETLPLTSAFLAWGGVSVHLQADALCERQFSMKTYYTGKIFSSVTAYVITKAVAGDLAVTLLFMTVVISAMMIISVVRNLFFPKQPRQLLFRQRRHS